MNAQLQASAANRTDRTETQTATRPGWPERLQRLRPWVGALLVAALAGEATARLDDWLFNDTPVLADADRARDLTHSEPWGARGKPNGAYRHWRLNSDGFNGPELQPSPPARRVMIMGASETFGLYEGKSLDYPRQLATELKRRGFGDIDVINASLAGLTLPYVEAYWTHWASRFKPDIVLIYPSAHFYLSDQIPAAPKVQATAAPIPRSDHPSRLFMRLRDQVRQIPGLRTVRSNYIVSQALQGKPSDYVFTHAPANHVEAFGASLAKLAEAIERSGATPILATQALKMPAQLSPADRAELSNFRVFFPRAMPDAFPDFSAKARDITFKIGKERGWQTIDVAGRFSGQRSLFADPVHFTTEGSRRLAAFLADELQPLLRKAPTRGTGAR